jgi:hypothetical protein
MTPQRPAALPPRGCSIHADRRTSYWPSDTIFLGCLTFELRGRQRRDARARLAKMYRVPPTGPAWPAVGAPFERGVRRHCVLCVLNTREPGRRSEQGPHRQKDHRP